MRILPFHTEISTGNDTPRSLYKKLYWGQPYSFLLESGKGSEKTSRYSITGGKPMRVLKAKKDCIEIIEKDRTREITGDPVLELEKLLQVDTVPASCLPRHFWGGCVGFMGYESAHFFEKLPRTAKDDLELPDCVFIFPRELIVVDHAKGVTRAIVLMETDRDSDNGNAEGLKRLEEFVKRASSKSIPPNERKAGKGEREPAFISFNQTKEEFEEKVRTVKDYIREGDIYQANISRRIETDFHGDPFALYECLFAINPSPFSSFLALDHCAIVSGSPERLVNVQGSRVVTRPIAGTRPRGMDSKSDKEMADELILNEKERAEHLMLVDLERNDLGRICRAGTVEVDEFMTLESYSHVWHIISNVQGELRGGVGLREILSACFPGGTITGCPKVRCMEIIDEIEPTARGPYTGSIGYMGYDGNLDLNIIIRTIVLKNNRAYIQVGAGIVADSDPEREFYETEKKGEAMLEALSMMKEKQNIPAVF